MRNIIPVITTILVVAIFGSIAAYVLTEFQGQIAINETAHPEAASTISSLFSKSLTAIGFLPMVTLLLVVSLVIGIVVWFGVARQ